MSLFVLNLGSRYDVYGFLMFYGISPLIICLFYVTFDLHLWPSFCQGHLHFVIRCIWCCWMFVPKMKFVGSVEFEIWAIVWRKLNWCHYDVIPHLIFMKFLYKSTKGIPNFRSIKHTKAEINSREFNRELWRKKMKITSL